MWFKEYYSVEQIRAENPIFIMAYNRNGYNCLFRQVHHDTWVSGCVEYSTKSLLEVLVLCSESKGFQMHPLLKLAE
jgi:hypothetical protein